MTPDDKSYFLARAESELELARRASHENAARAHFMLAGAYLDRVYGSSPADIENSALAGRMTGQRRSTGT